MPEAVPGPLLGHVCRLFRSGAVTGLSDAQILDWFIFRRDEAGEAAFAALVRRHGPMVLGVCRRVLRDRHTAEDAFQATFLVLAHKARSIARRDRLANWLYGVAFRSAQRARSRGLRRRARETPVVASVETAKPDDTAPDDELLANFDEELARLPVRLRAAAVLCELEGLTRAAAFRLGIPERTLCSRLASAGRRLRARLARRGVAPSVPTSTLALSRDVKAVALPVRLTESTVQAAMRIAAGADPSSVATASVAALIQGVLNAMLLSRLKTIAAVMTVATGLAACAAAFARQDRAPGNQPGANQRGIPPAVNPTPPPTSSPSKGPRAPIVVEGEGNRVDYLAWSPNGRMLATAIQLPGRGKVPSIKMGVKVWDARTGELLWTLVENTPRGFCSPVTFSPDSETVAALVDLTELKLWDTATGKEKATFDVAGDWDCWNLAFSPDGKAIAAVGHPIPTMHDSGYVRLFDAKTGKVLWEHTKAHAERVYALAFSPDGKTLASGSMDLTVKLWDAATGELLRTLAGHGERGVYRVAFSPDGKTLASGGMDGTCRIWDVDKGELRHTIGGYGGAPMSFVAFSPRDGKTLLTAGYPTEVLVGAEPRPQIHLIDPQGGNLPRVVPHSTPPTAWAKRTVPVQGLRFIREVAFSPDGKTLAIGGEGEVEGKKMKLVLQPLED